jgi:hypothetical protein
MKEANLAVTNLGMIDEVLFISSNLQCQEEWKLDSGASNHMCSHRNWFISYQSIDEVQCLWEIVFPVKLLGLVVLESGSSLVLLGN